MITLYIIGNGFDLRHGLPTGYSCFHEHAKEFLEEIGMYYVGENSEERPWHDFENYLGKYNWKLFYNTFNNIDVMSESFRPRDAYCLQDELEEQANDLIESIQKLFYEWVSDIDVSLAHAKEVFDPDSKFLTFNYTDTLQKVYGISNNKVFHIHGNATIAEELIFGHGESQEEEPEFDENGDSNRTMFTDAENAAKNPFYAFRKPVYELIEKNSDYFSSLSGVKKIVVIGHSLNDIDLPYFREVARKTSKCRWAVYCYKESDFEHHKCQLERCGVDASCIETCAYS